MAQEFKSLADFHAHDFDTLIDVRSPAEYAQDHIPGAINLPVLDNEERARVGTIYTREDAFKAKKIGAALVAQNAARHLQGPLADKGGGWKPLIYCWRGGQRSGSFTSILQQVGWRADTVAGGYQAYRRLVARNLHDDALIHRLIVLDGNTGTAKTELLHRLKSLGHQIIDLEGLAAHRGSVFGAVDHPQPSQKMFEGELAANLLALDPARPVLVEAESSKIGRLLIPPSIWDAMKIAPRISISAPIEQRAAYLVRAYADIAQDSERLDARLNALAAHQGCEKVAHWQVLATQGQLQTLAGELMQDHYDPSYTRSRASHSANVVAEIPISDLTPDGLGKGALDLARAIEKLDHPKPV